MNAQITITIFIIMAIVVLRRPQLGAILIWFAIWLYPNTAMYGTIPGDIRLDDLFVCFVFAVLLKRHKGRLPISTTLGLSAAWFVAQLIGNSAGVVLADQNIAPVSKFVLKAMYVPMTVAIMSLAVKSEEDIDLCIRWICIAGVAAAILGIATVYWPRRFEAFYIRDIQPHLGSVLDRIESKGIWARRATGSLGIMATALVLLNTSILSLCRWLFGKHDNWLRALTAAFCFTVCSAGLIQTQTRGAMIAFAIAVLWVLLGQRKFPSLLYSKAESAFAMAMLSSTIVIYKPSLLKILTARFTGATGVTFGEGAEVRVGVWNYLMTKFNQAYMFTGIGMVSSQRLYGKENWGTTHNTYLGSFVYTGVLGFIVLINVVLKAFRLSNRLLGRQLGDNAAMMGTYLAMITIALLVTGVTIEDFQETICMQLFFACMYLAELTFNISATKAKALSDLRIAEAKIGR